MIFWIRGGDIPKEFKRAKILGVVKPGKDGNAPSDHRPISLLSILYKLFERLILNRLKPIVEYKFPIEQAGFRSHRSCNEQITALSSSIENGFQRGKKTMVVFVDLTAAYDTVWRKGLLVKF